MYRWLSKRPKAPTMLLLSSLLCSLWVHPAHAAGDLIVNSADDHDDGACTVSDCTLREAIIDANNQSGPNTIKFAITDGSSLGNGVYTIEVEDELPYLRDDGTTIDGFSQAVPGAVPGRPRVEITGSGMLADTNGLVLFDSGSHVLKGLVINGFGGSGVVMVYPGANNNRIENCYIGVNATGSAAAPNGYAPFFVTNDFYLSDGVSIFYGAHENTIGGIGKGNVISGQFDGAGIYLTVSAYSNRIEGNYLGTDATGTKTIGNLDGVLCSDDGNNVIGGTTNGAGNLISGNADGVDIFDSPGNFVQGNRIGTNKDGTRALPNGTGVEVEGDFTTIGGTADGAGNLISGNREDGIFINEVFGARVWGNKIGTDLSGNRAIPNGTNGGDMAGVYVNDSEEIYIGGGLEAMGNLISGNAVDGVSLNNTFAEFGDIGALVANNLIGTNLAGTRALGRQTNGIFVDFYSGQIGIVGNLVSGNDTGLRIVGEEILVSLNGIGTNGNLNGAIPNRRGVALINAESVALGMDDTDEGELMGNFVSGNTGNGIEILDSGAVILHDNNIGCQLDPTRPLPNGGHGVVLLGNTADVYADHNNIVNNRASGVWATKNVRYLTLTQNIIGRNGQLGIDLQSASEVAGAATPNDTLDRDTGANGLQNFPVLAEMPPAGDEATKPGTASTTTVRGTLNSARNRRYRIEVFGNLLADPSGYGEGEVYLQTITVTTNARGVANFATNIALTPSLTSVSATATDVTTGETSEFGPSVSLRNNSGGATK